MDALSKIDDFVREGRLPEALAACKEQVRARPADMAARAVYFDFCTLFGEWERCQTQLDVIRELGGDPMTWGAYYGLLAASRERDLCWKEGRVPVFAGEGSDDLRRFGAVVQELGNSGKWDALVAWRQEEGHPVWGPGRVNGKAFEECAPADDRNGGFLELAVDGVYAWMALEEVGRLMVAHTAKRLSSRVWAPVRINPVKGEAINAWMFLRLPGVEASWSTDELLAKTVSWREDCGDLVVGRGAALLTLDDAALALCEVEDLVFDTDEAGGGGTAGEEP